MIPKCFVIYGTELQLPWGSWVAANSCLLHCVVLALNPALNCWEAFDALTREHFSSSQGPRCNRLRMFCSKTGTRLYTLYEILNLELLVASISFWISPSHRKTIRIRRFLQYPRETKLLWSILFTKFQIYIQYIRQEIKYDISGRTQKLPTEKGYNLWPLIPYRSLQNQANMSALPV